MVNVPYISQQDIDIARQKYIKKTGRPSKFNAAIAAEIITRLESGETLTQICSDVRMPALPTLWDWRGKIPAFGEAVACARRRTAAVLVDMSVDAIMQASPDDMPTVRLAEGRAKHLLEVGRVYDPGTFGNQVRVNHDIVIETMADRIRRLTGSPVEIPAEFRHIVKQIKE
jgi:hypothetical protein